METSIGRQASPGKRLSLIEDEHSVTPAVEAAMANTASPRLRFVMDSLVRHLHEFLSEVRLSDEEFEFALAYVASLGHATHASHNEVVLAADVLGLSTLVTVMNNNTRNGRTPGALLGPFY